jgi:hypothetical protein
VSQTWIDLGLLLHILGIVSFSGGSIGSLIAVNAVWPSLKTSPTQALGAFHLSEAFANLPIYGTLLMFISGILMLVGRNWLYLSQPWLIIKLVLFLLLFLNTMLVSRPISAKLNKLMPQWMLVNGAIPSFMVQNHNQAGTTELPTKAEVENTLALIRNRFFQYHSSQSLIFLGVLIISIFKFN